MILRILILALTLVTVSYATEYSGGGGGGGADGVGYDEVADEGTPLTQRSQINFAGDGVTCADDTDKTTCTISGGGAAYDTVEDDDVAVTQRTTINFEGSVACVDDTTKTTCTGTDTNTSCANGETCDPQDVGLPTLADGEGWVSSGVNTPAATSVCQTSGTNCPADAVGYDTVDEEGTPLTQRAALNFAGSVVTCADDTDKTTCTFSNHTTDTWCGGGQTCSSADVGLATLGAGQVWLGASETPTSVCQTSGTNCPSDAVGYATVEEEGTPLTQRASLNFTGASVTCADDTTKTTCTLTDANTSCANGETCDSADVGLGALGANEAWVGASETPTSVCQTSGTGCPTDEVGYDTVDDEDTPLTQRATLNFEGDGVVCADDTDQTTCTITGGGTTSYAVFTGTCDGSTDDEAALESLYTTLNAAGGGTIYIPNGKTCAVASDVAVLSNVLVVCGEGGGFTSTAGGSFTNGLFAASAQTNIGFLGCRFALAGKATASFYTTGNSSGIIFKGNTVSGGDTTTNAQTYINLSCDNASDVNCGVVAGNTVSCASGTADTGISFVTGTADDDHSVRVENNDVRNCDVAGIVTDGRAVVAENELYQTGSTGIGVTLNGNHSSASRNVIEIAGTSGVGIKLVGQYQATGGNSLYVVGNTATGIKVDAGAGLFGTIYGNTWRLFGSSAIGVDVNNFAAFISVTGNNGNVSGTESGQIHVVSGGGQSQTMIAGNVFVNGAYGVVPPGGSSVSDLDAGGGLINSRIVGNIMFGMSQAGVIIATGWHVIGNTINWLESTAVAIMIGDTRTYGAPCSAHSVISGNHLHCAACPALIRLTPVDDRCGTGADQYEACTSDGDCAGTCDPVICENILIGNNMLMSTATNGIGIDFGSTEATSCANVPTVDGVTIDGNMCQLTAAGQECIAFCDVSTPASGHFEGFVLGEMAMSATSASTRLAGWLPRFGEKPIQRAACFILENVAAATDDKMAPIVPDAVTITGARCHCHDPDGSAESPKFNCDGTIAQFRLSDDDNSAIGDTITCSTGTTDATLTTFSTPYETTAGEVFLVDTTNTPSDTDEVYEICVLYK